MASAPAPSRGLRIAIERSARGGPPWIYRGTIERGNESHRVEATLNADGTATVEVDGQVVAQQAATLGERVRLLLRAIHRQSASEGLPAPARRIVRWRDGERVV